MFYNQGLAKNWKKIQQHRKLFRQTFPFTNSYQFASNMCWIYVTLYTLYNYEQQFRNPYVPCHRKTKLFPLRISQCLRNNAIYVDVSEYKVNKSMKLYNIFPISNIFDFLILQTELYPLNVVHYMRPLLISIHLLFTVFDHGMLYCRWTMYNLYSQSIENVFQAVF